MSVLAKKVCMIGDFAVGKTSLVSCYVHSVFSDKYLSTLGVKIDTKVVTLPDKSDLKLVLWDIAGTDRFRTRDASYLRGAAGYLLVIDGTRRYTLDTALQLKQSVDQALDAPPFVILCNKFDLQAQWEITPAEIQDLTDKDWPVFKTSAKEGANVNQAFQVLADRLVK